MVRQQPRPDDSERAEFLLPWLQTVRDRGRKTHPRHDTRTSLVELKNASVCRTDERKTAAVTLPGSPAGSATAQIKRGQSLLAEANWIPSGNQDWHHTPEPAFAGVRLNAVNRTRSASSVDDATSCAVEFQMGGTRQEGANDDRSCPVVLARARCEHSRLGKYPSRTVIRCGYGAVWCKPTSQLSSSSSTKVDSSLRRGRQVVRSTSFSAIPISLKGLRCFRREHQVLAQVVLRLTGWDRLRRLLSSFCERLAPRRPMSMNAWRQGVILWVGLQQTGSRRWQDRQALLHVSL